MDKIDRKPEKPKLKPFLIGKELKTKDLQKTAVGRARGSPQNQNQNPRIAYAERRVKPLARLLRCATALRVTLPQHCGSRCWYGRKVPFGPDAAHTTRALLNCDSMNEERCECGHRFGSPRGQVSLMDRMAHYDVCPLTLAGKRAASSPAKPVRRSEPKTGPAVSDDRS